MKNLVYNTVNSRGFVMYQELENFSCANGRAVLHCAVAAKSDVPVQTRYILVTENYKTNTFTAKRFVNKYNAVRQWGKFVYKINPDRAPTTAPQLLQSCGTLADRAPSVKMYELFDTRFSVVWYRAPDTKPKQQIVSTRKHAEMIYNQKVQEIWPDTQRHR